MTNEGSGLKGERCRTKPLASLTGDEVNEAYVVVGLFTAGKQSSLHVYTYRVKRQEAEPTRPSRRLRLAIQILGTCIARSGDRVRYEARDAGNSDG